MAAIVAANWKMNLRRESAQKLAQGIADKGFAPWLFPSYPLFEAVRDSGVSFGAQNVCAFTDGAFTGDVSAEMLADAGCSMVLVGHSERRQGYNEDDALLLAKLRRAAAAGLRSLFCVGETLEQREEGRAQAVLEEQLAVLATLNEVETKALCAVAYEPIWAIGTGRTATPEIAQEMHSYARAVLEELGLEVPLLYGGSVKPENIEGLLAQDDVNGVLVGGASLKLESLSAICQAASEAK